MFLLSFGRENFVGFTLCGARRRVFHCSYPWIWCLHISDLCVCVCFFFLISRFVFFRSGFVFLLFLFKTRLDLNSCDFWF